VQTYASRKKRVNRGSNCRGNSLRRGKRQGGDSGNLQLHESTAAAGGRSYLLSEGDDIFRHKVGNCWGKQPTMRELGVCVTWKKGETSRFIPPTKGQGGPEIRDSGGHSYEKQILSGTEWGRVSHHK